ncbi:MAG: Na+/H+ antiporter subunit E [Oscillochloridaceae bacterium umkhey_bin13]
MLALNFFLALTWMVLQRSFTFVDFFVGFVFGFLIIALTHRTLRDQFLDTAQFQRIEDIGNYPARAWSMVSLAIFALVSIVKSNIDVARLILRPQLKLNPGIVRIPLDVKSEVGMTLLANLITLTPGTVSVDISTDRKSIYVHCIDVPDAAALRDDIKSNFERRVMAIFP